MRSPVNPLCSGRQSSGGGGGRAGRCPHVEDNLQQELHCTYGREAKRKTYGHYQAGGKWGQLQGKKAPSKWLRGILDTTEEVEMKDTTLYLGLLQVV